MGDQARDGKCQTQMTGYLMSPNIYLCCLLLTYRDVSEGNIFPVHRNSHPTQVFSFGDPEENVFKHDGRIRKGKPHIGMDKMDQPALQNKNYNKSLTKSRPKRNILAVLPRWMRMRRGQTGSRITEEGLGKEHQCYYNPSTCF